MQPDFQRTALVMCIADASGNPRPNRIIRLLSENGFAVDVLTHPLSRTLAVRQVFAFGQPGRSLYNQGVRAWCVLLAGLSAGLRLKALAERLYEWRDGLLGIDQLFPDHEYDLVVVENLPLLPFAFRRFAGRARSRIVFDAREFYSREFESYVWFRLLRRPVMDQLCREYLPRCDHLLTVSPGLAKAYRDEYGVEMQILRSAPHYSTVPVRPTRRDRIRMVHHGAVMADRGLPNLIEIVRRLDDRFELDFYLVGNSRHIADLRKQAAGCHRIAFREPVPLDRIVPMLNEYDIGFYYLEPRGFNVTFNLPNKFFEFVQARLAIAIGPSPDMADLVWQYGLGFVAPEFSLDAMVRTLSGLTAEHIDQAKRNSDAAAAELCYEQESAALMRRLDALQPRSLGPGS